MERAGIPIPTSDCNSALNLHGLARQAIVVGLHAGRVTAQQDGDGANIHGGVGICVAIHRTVQAPPSVEAQISKELCRHNNIKL